jgi:hypothetical protein
MNPLRLFHLNSRLCWFLCFSKFYYVSFDMHVSSFCVAKFWHCVEFWYVNCANRCYFDSCNRSISNSAAGLLNDCQLLMCSVE